MRTTILVACLWLATNPLWGKIVFYSKVNGISEVYTMDSDGSNQIQLTFNDVSDSFGTWSPNGQQIVFQTERDGNWEIYTMDANGSNLRNLTRHPKNDNFPDWSPDGSQIVFNSFRDGAVNVHVMDADGSNVRQLTHMRIEHWELAAKPRWSPDGQWILFEGDIFEANLIQGRQIYAMRPDGTKRWQVSEPIPHADMFLGDWSPDGKHVLYKASIGGKEPPHLAIIATLDANGGEKVKEWEIVPLPKMRLQTLTFNVDGKCIFFSGKKADRWNLYRYRLSTGELTQLTDNVWDDKQAQEWDPRLSVSPQKLIPTRWGEIKSD